MATLVLDIETIPDPLVPGPNPTADRPDPFPPPACHQVVEVGACWLDGGQPARLTTASAHANDERGMLAWIVDLIEKRKPLVVGWNSRGFDMPVIATRAMKHGLSMPWWFGGGQRRARYSDAMHLDVKDFLSDNGAAPSCSLDAVAKMIGLPGKMGVDGSDVAGMYAQGFTAAIARYCLTDVVQTAIVMCRFRLLRGDLSAASHDAAVDAILQASTDAEFLAAVDRTRVLVGPRAEQLRMVGT